MSIVYVNVYIYMYIYDECWFLSVYKVLQPIRGLLEFDSRVLGDLYLPLIVWYIYIYIPTFISLSILSIKVGGLGIHMSDCENPRFTERTFTNLGRSHRLPHVCTIMIYGKLGGYRLQELLYLYIYIWWWTMNNMWYLGIANVDIREIWWHNLEKGYR